MTDHDRLRPELAGVPETLLWPLWNRAQESQRADALVTDPMAEDLVARIDYDFRGQFGKPSVLHAIRAHMCDGFIAEYLARTPDLPVVVALGEGLETQAWRVGKPDLRWISVDLSNAMALRRRLLPAATGHVLHEGSALDLSWADHVPAGAAPFISASGLLMYFSAEEVATLLAAIAARMPGATLFFDTIPPFFSKKSLKGLNITKTYVAPPMPWGIRMSGIGAFLGSAGGWRLDQVQSYGAVVPGRTPVYSLLSRVPVLRDRLSGALVLARAPEA